MSMTKPSNRIGRFSLSYQIVDDNPIMALLMLSGKLIVRAEARHEMAAIEYHAHCADFDEVGRGQQVPEYIAEFKEEKVLENHPGAPLNSVKIIQVFQRWVRKK